MGEDRGPAFVVWGKKDNLSNGIAEIGFAYSKAEEKMLQTNDFKVATQQHISYIETYNILMIQMIRRRLPTSLQSTVCMLRRCFLGI